MGADTGTPLPVVVAYGEEPFFLDEIREKSLRSGQKHRSIYMDGLTVSEEEVTDALGIQSLDGRLPAMVLDNAQKIKGSLGLGTWFEAPGQDFSLVAICRGPKISTFWSGVAKRGRLIERPKLKPWGDEVLLWAIDYAKKQGLVLTKKVGQDLLVLAGTELPSLASELRKIALIRQGEVSSELLLAVVAPVNQAETYRVVEAVADKDPKRALRQASLFLEREGDQGYVPLALALCRTFEKLSVARSMADAKEDPDAIASRIEMHPWRYKSWFAPLVAKRTLTECSKAMALLCRLDLEMKTQPRGRRTRLALAIWDLSTG